jgi:hypothetical protein
MPDPTLFHGIAVLIDDEVAKPSPGVAKLIQVIEDANCHVVKLDRLPNDNSLSNLRQVAFFVLDWNLYGASLSQAAEGGPVQAPERLVQQNEDSIVAFLKNLKTIRFAPVFIFTDESVDKISERLNQRGLNQDSDKSHILVMDKNEVADKGLFAVLSEWMKTAPSVYVLKAWERAYEKAKNEMFLDFYVSGSLWPLVFWKNFMDDSVPPAALLGELIGRNLASRMSPFDFDIQPFESLLNDVADNKEAYGSIVRKVLEGERFLAEKRLAKDSFEPGDIFSDAEGYWINIRPDCDCVPRGHDKLNSLDLYLLKGSEREPGKFNYDSVNGLIPEQDNETVLFPVHEGRALSFKFRKIYTKRWQALKANRIGRLLPPFLTRLQQRYSSYLQRPGLSRLPSSAIPDQPKLASEQAVAEAVPTQHPETASEPTTNDPSKPTEAGNPAPGSS